MRRKAEKSAKIKFFSLKSGKNNIKHCIINKNLRILILPGTENKD